jgi:hypothetical protein
MQTLSAPADNPEDRAATPYFAPSPARYFLMLAEMDRWAARRALAAA